MDLALNNLQKLICHKTQTTNQYPLLQTFRCFLDFAVVFLLLFLFSPLFIISIARFSLPNSIPIFWRYILIFFGRCHDIIHIHEAGYLFLGFYKFVPHSLSILKIYHHHHHAISTDIPDPLSPPILIVHCFRQVFRVTSRIGTELLYVGSCWSSCLCSSM